MHLRPHGALDCSVGVVFSACEGDEIHQAYYAADAGPESTLARCLNDFQMEVIQ